MLLLLPSASSPALVLPLHRHAHTASIPSYRCPAPELKDGRNRAALKRALRSLLPGKAAQPTPSSVDTVAVPTPSEIDAEALEPSSASDEPRPSQASAAASSAFAESPEELAGLVALTELLAPDLPDAGSASWYPEVHGEVRLLRFLRKAKGDVVGAAGRYREMLAWRREEDVDAVRERLVAMRMGPADIPSYGPMQRMMPVTIWAPEELPGVPNEERHGLQVCHRRPRPNHLPSAPLDLPVCPGLGGQVFHLGRWDSRGLVAAKARGELSQAQFMQHWVYANECACRLSTPLLPPRRASPRRALSTPSPHLARSRPGTSRCSWRT